MPRGFGATSSFPLFSGNLVPPWRYLAGVVAHLAAPGVSRRHLYSESSLGTRRKERDGLGYDSIKSIALARTAMEDAGSSRTAIYARYHVNHIEPNVVDREKHVLVRARSPMCAPQGPEGDAHGAGIKDM
eukprot:CAMPEP_0172609528 /NCGR_PEP_ID=MMETSP1068-20121228/29519_1 /TAXON_ID=35684 /ORGANISM="Pseudopedinella elastica, Strain CCMP716" /LENGTH=129 /DNA_ID=CAMNT_0013413067 /DNA_START=89 /DNA_END=479 /DNA_ORIENTATION=+